MSSQFSSPSLSEISWSSPTTSISTPPSSTMGSPSSDKQLESLSSIPRTTATSPPPPIPFHTHPLIKTLPPLPGPSRSPSPTSAVTQQSVPLSSYPGPPVPIIQSVERQSLRSTHKARERNPPPHIVSIKGPSNSTPGPSTATAPTPFILGPPPAPRIIPGSMRGREDVSISEYTTSRPVLMAPAPPPRKSGGSERPTSVSTLGEVMERDREEQEEKPTTWDDSHPLPVIIRRSESLTRGRSRQRKQKGTDKLVVKDDIW